MMNCFELNEHNIGQDASRLIQIIGIRDADLITKLNLVLGNECLPGSNCDLEIRQDAFDHLPDGYQYICYQLLNDKTAEYSDIVYYMQIDLKRIKRAIKALKILHNEQLAYRVQTHEPKKFKLKKK